MFDGSLHFFVQFTTQFQSEFVTITPALLCFAFGCYIKALFAQKRTRREMVKDKLSDNNLSNQKEVKRFRILEPADCSADPIQPSLGVIPYMSLSRSDWTYTSQSTD